MSNYVKMPWNLLMIQSNRVGLSKFVELWRANIRLSSWWGIILEIETLACSISIRMMRYLFLSFFQISNMLAGVEIELNRDYDDDDDDDYFNALAHYIPLFKVI